MPNDTQDRLSMTVNGHQLDGLKKKGKWFFTCSFPEIAKAHSGSGTFEFAVNEFMARALKAKE